MILNSFEKMSNMPKLSENRKQSVFLNISFFKIDGPVYKLNSKYEIEAS